MELVFNVEIDDWLALSDYHVRHSPTVQRQVQVLRVACAGLSLVAITGVGYLTGDRFWIWMAGGLVGATIGFWFFPRWFYQSNLRSMRKLAAEGRNQSALGRFTLTAEEGGLRETSAGADTLHAWSALERVVSTPTHELIYVSAISGIAVGRERVEQGDLDALVATVRERMEAARS